LFHKGNEKNHIHTSEIRNLLCTNVKVSDSHVWEAIAIDGIGGDRRRQTSQLTKDIFSIVSGDICEFSRITFKLSWEGMSKGYSVKSG
jgi:hypothetical protein